MRQAVFQFIFPILFLAYSAMVMPNEVGNEASGFKLVNREVVILLNSAFASNEVDRNPIETKQTVFISWRLLASDTATTQFNIYRSVPGAENSKINIQPLRQGTNFTDTISCPDLASCLDYQWVIEAVDGNGFNRTLPRAANNRSGDLAIVINNGTHGFGRNVSFGYFDSDDELDFTLRFSDLTVDPYFRMWRNEPGTYKIIAFNGQGQSLWRYDMGNSIERGIWYSPYLIYDLDQDGVSELIVKGSQTELPRDKLADVTGRITQGEEALKIISGRDGARVLATAPWPDRSGFEGDIKPYSQYNEYSRNQMAIAFVDGVHPHVVIERGTYGKQKVYVYRYSKDSGLTLVWQWENSSPKSSEQSLSPAEIATRQRWWGQGAHTIRVGDVDGDQKDEIILGATALDHDGSPLWSINRGDVDHIYLGDIDPLHKGLEVYYGSERGHGKAGMGLISALDGQFYWHNSEPTSHIHKEGLCADLFRDHIGTECYSGEANRSAYWLWNSQGKRISDKNIGGLAPKAAYWSGSAQKSLIRLAGDPNGLLFADMVNLETGEVVDQLYKPRALASKDRQYFKLLAVMDILGDWREEIIAVSRGQLVIYSSTIPTTFRQKALLTDAVYAKNAMLSSMGYYHQPLLSYDLESAFSEQLVSLNKPIETPPNRLPR